MSRTTVVRKLAIIAATAAMCGWSTAWAAAPNPEAAANAKTMADNLIKQAENIEARTEKATGDVKAAATAWVEAIKAQAAAMSKLSVGVGSGDELAIKAAQGELEKARDQANRAFERFNVRQNLAALGPVDRQLEMMKESTPPANKALLEAVVAAKEKAVAAGNAFFAALTPDASWNDIENVRDTYVRRADELELANRALLFANTRSRIAAQPGADAVAAKIAELAKTDDALLAALKFAKEQTREARILDRKRTIAIKELQESLSKPAKQ